MDRKDWPKKIGEIVFKGITLKAYQSVYRNGRPAIFLEEDGIPFATISINLPDREFEEGEFPVKNWTENEEITTFILKHTGLFEDTGKIVPTGRVQAPVWRFKKEA